MVVIILGRVAQFLLMLAILKISTHFLTPTEMGKMALLSSSVAFVSLFLINPVGMYVNRQLYAWNNVGLVKRYLTYHGFYILIIALMATIFLGIVNCHGFIISHVSPLFFIFFVFATLLFNTINQTSIPSLNMFGFRVWFTVLSLLTLLSGLIFSVVLVYYMSPIAMYWLLGLLAGQILFAIIGTFVFFTKINTHNALVDKKVTPSFQDVKKVFGFSWPVAVAVGLTWFQNQSYRFFVEHSFSLDILGLFVAGYGISAGIFAAFESIFATYFQPFFYQHLNVKKGGGETTAWNDYAMVMIPSAVLLFFGILVLAPKLTLLMLATNFKNASVFVMWGASVELFRVVVNVYSLAAHANRDTKVLIAPNLLGAVVSIVLICVLIPYLGISGVALALAVSGLSVTLFLHVRIKNKFPITVPYKAIGRAIVWGVASGGIYYLLEWSSLGRSSMLFIFLQILIIGVFLLFAEFLLIKKTNFAVRFLSSNQLQNEVLT